MAIWPVNIAGNPAAFVAVLQPTAPVGTVYADSGDAVYWNNTTTETHQISLLVATQNKGVVTPDHQSDAFFVTGNSGDTIPYNCLLHPEMKGTIVVT
jgi:plastocyanin